MLEQDNKNIIIYVLIKRGNSEGNYTTITEKKNITKACPSFLKSRASEASLLLFSKSLPFVTFCTNALVFRPSVLSCHFSSFCIFFYPTHLQQWPTAVPHGHFSFHVPCLPTSSPPHYHFLCPSMKSQRPALNLVTLGCGAWVCHGYTEPLAQLLWQSCHNYPPPWASLAQMGGWGVEEKGGKAWVKMEEETSHKGNVRVGQRQWVKVGA